MVVDIRPRISKLFPQGTYCLHLLPKISNLDSSVHKTLLHMSRVQFWCTSENLLLSSLISFSQ
uniref:Uncharacterized protein n=1 Tax=Anguilla anguilla TaxID=7936 RepID=A0A0E9VWI7_ANGAN